MSRTRPVARTAALLATIALTGTATASMPAGAAPVGTPCAAGTPLASDFDGDGLADLVVSAYDRHGADYAPEHWFQPGDGSTATWLAGTGSLRTADLNGDLCADAILFSGGHEPSLTLALGTPDGLDVAGATPIELPQASDLGEDVDRTLTFTVSGLRHDGISQVVVSGHHVWEDDSYGGFIDVFTLTEGSRDVAGTQTWAFTGVEGDIAAFGEALASSGRTFAVGVPYATVSGHVDAGAVLIYSADASDPTRMVLRRKLTQNSSGVPDSAQVHDHFGATLAMRNGRLAIGAPGESDGKILNSGLVQPITWHESTNTYTAYRAITQDTSGVPGTNEKYDRFGSTLAIARGLTASGSYDIVIGARESVGTLKDAGSVTVANFTRKLFRTYTQATSGIPGNPQAGDGFYRVGVLQGSSGVDTVLIGAPGEDSHGITDYGRAVRSNGKKLTSKTTWTNIPLPSGAPEGIRGWGSRFPTSD